MTYNKIPTKAKTNKKRQYAKLSRLEAPNPKLLWAKTPNQDEIRLIRDDADDQNKINIPRVTMKNNFM